MTLDGKLAHLHNLIIRLNRVNEGPHNQLNFNVRHILRILQPHELMTEIEALDRASCTEQLEILKLQ